MSEEIYKYLNFDQLDEYSELAEKSKIPVAQIG
jgi:aconitate hydratase 2 / 2-methylisocitrate dehydratase